MKIEQLAVTLYTLRDYVKTADELALTLKRVRQIGYRAVQISGVGEIEAQKIRSLADNAGLVICATHEPAASILNEPEAVARRLETLGCKYTAYPFPSEVDLSSKKAVTDWIASLDASGQVLRRYGKTLTYHNHAVEFMRCDGKLLLDMIYDLTNADSLQGEIDTYWVQYGGGDPAKWCNRLKNRLPLLHIKDYGVSLDNEPVFKEIGYGNLNWKEIIFEAEKSGCQWYIVEQDTCEGDPFDCITRSFNYIKGNIPKGYDNSWHG